MTEQPAKPTEHPAGSPPQEPPSVPSEKIDREGAKPPLFQFEISPDRMSVLLRKLSPPPDGQPPATVPDLLKGLADLKVSFGIDQEVLASAVNQVAATNRPVKDLVVAKGTPPRPGQDAVLTLGPLQDVEKLLSDEIGQAHGKLLRDGYARQDNN